MVIIEKAPTPCQLQNDNHYIVSFICILFPLLPMRMVRFLSVSKINLILTYCHIHKQNTLKHIPLMERDKLKASLPFLVFLFTFHASFSLVTSQSDSCSCNLNLKVPIPFDTTSLQCLSVWDAQGFILRVSAPSSSLSSFSLLAIYGLFLFYFFGLI